MNNQFQPNWISAPGRTIEDLLCQKNIEINVFAQRIDCSTQLVKGLLAGKEPITYKIAEQLGYVLGGSTNFWIQREAQYREELSLLQEKEMFWIKSLPLNDMIKFGWIPKKEDKIASCLSYFNVSNVNVWEQKYSKFHNKVALRTSLSFKSGFAPTSVWFRQAEIQSSHIACNPWDPELFILTLAEIRPLTKRKNPKDFIPKLRELCAKCGVAVAIVRTPTGCSISGATWFLNQDKAVILLSFRYLSDDHFWFTFFHEAGHLILHGHKEVFIEQYNKYNEAPEEQEANYFASDILIPPHLREKFNDLKGNPRNIPRFAVEAGISSGIVVGQMQHNKMIDYKYLNAYKKRYNWDDISDLDLF